MNAETRQAVLDSIEHWHENLAMLQLNHWMGANNFDDLVEDVHIGQFECPLCKMFHSCYDCPIALKTEYVSCGCTPWTVASNWMRGYHDFSKKGAAKEWFAIGYKAIAAEINFLYTLLK